MARLFESFVHEDEKVAAAVQHLLQTELDLREDVFLSSDTSQIFAGDPWLPNIKEALSAAPILILMLSRRSVARPWVNFEAGAAWLADKMIIPVCYGNLSKGCTSASKLCHSGGELAVRGVLPAEKRRASPEPRYVVQCSVPGTLAEQGQAMKDGTYERLANALAEFKDD